MEFPIGAAKIQKCPLSKTEHIGEMKRHMIEYGPGRFRKKHTSSIVDISLILAPSLRDCAPYLHLGMTVFHHSFFVRNGYIRCSAFQTVVRPTQGFRVSSTHFYHVTSIPLLLGAEEIDCFCSDERKPLRKRLYFQKKSALCSEQRSKSPVSSSATRVDPCNFGGTSVVGTSAHCI